MFTLDYPIPQGFYTLCFYPFILPCTLTRVKSHCSLIAVNLVGRNFEVDYFYYIVLYCKQQLTLLSQPLSFSDRSDLADLPDFKDSKSLSESILSAAGAAIFIVLLCAVLQYTFSELD